MSTYVVSRDPNKYGGQQKTYIEQSHAIVEKAVNEFRKAVQAKKNLELVFFETLDSFGVDRHAIAVQHDTNHATAFGIRRDQAAAFITFMTTMLKVPYDAYNEKLISIIQKHLNTIKHDLKTWEKTELKISRKPHLERASSTEFVIVNKTNFNEFFINGTEKEYIKLCALCSVKPEENFDISHFCHLSKDINAMQNLKKNSIKDYQTLKNFAIIFLINTLVPQERKSDWVIITERFEVNGKLYALRQYFTWMYRNLKDDPVEHMTNRSIVTLSHQDPFLIEIMLKDIAKIFKKALEWDGKNLKQLQEQVVLLQYELSNTTPFMRGSAAVSEWFEMAIYLYHRYKLTYNPNKWINLEALTLPFEEFEETYHSMIHLEKI